MRKCAFLWRDQVVLGRLGQEMPIECASRSSTAWFVPYSGADRAECGPDSSPQPGLCQTMTPSRHPREAAGPGPPPRTYTQHSRRPGIGGLRSHRAGAGVSHAHRLPAGLGSGLRRELPPLRRCGPPTLSLWLRGADTPYSPPAGARGSVEPACRAGAPMHRRSHPSKACGPGRPAAPPSPPCRCRPRLRVRIVPGAATTARSPRA